MENKTVSASDVVRNKLRILVEVLSASALLVLYIVMIAAFMLVIANQSQQAGSALEVPLAKAALKKEPPKTVCASTASACEEYLHE
jgi:hypothetical protein